MADIQDQIRARAKELIESGEYAAFIGWEAGRFEKQTTPLICLKPEDTDRLVFNEYCANNLAKYVQDLKRRGKVALIVRGCDSRAINRMIEDNQFKREDVYLLGIGCPQMKDRKTDAVFNKCTNCQHRNPVVYDEMIGEPVVETPPADRFLQATLVEGLDQQARQNFFNMAFEKCIRCYACRDVCPCCTCRICFVDQRRVGWQGKQNNFNENRFYGLVRAFHIADRCIECGECERVCPMELPLMSINRKLVKDMNNLFGEYESGMTAENPDVLRNYNLDDLEEFM
jgi:formate dehydrogenase subunit beta